MSLFQHSVLNKYIADLDANKVSKAWQLFQKHFHDPVIQENIRNLKEEEYQEGFVRDLFVSVFDYTLNPQPGYNFVLEKKSVTDATKSDGAILAGDSVIAVIELKDTGTAELEKVTTQAFGYKHKNKNCRYVITCNFEKIRFYIDDATDFEEFNLFTLTKEQFSLLFICLQKDCLLSSLTISIKENSLIEEENITNELYADYSQFRKALFVNIVEGNPGFDKLLLFKKTQKLLDRFLFIFFAEDRMLVPPNSVRSILQQWEELKSKYDAYSPLYERFKKYFGYLNEGHKGKQHEIFAYNGGLFAPDEILEIIVIDDDILYKATDKLSSYAFDTDVDVNILGHIFEHSLTEIEELQSELEGKTVEKNKTKRKKDGVFYTPRYITNYIVESTIGELCSRKKKELQIDENEFAPGKRKKNRKILLAKIDDYRDWLLQLTICDPACGSGAFLNAALDYLMYEHRLIDELKSRVFGATIIYSDIQNSILENNLFGVDINDDAIEIAKLSLWLRTAQKGRKLSNLSNNIKCGNSLIDDKKVSGDKAFSWNLEFPLVYANKGFDVIIGNPPYVFSREKISELDKKYYSEKYYSAQYQVNTYLLFIEQSIRLLRPDGIFGLIVPNAWLMVSSAKNLRDLLLRNTAIHEIINLLGYSFENVNVETIIIIASNGYKENNQLLIKENEEKVFVPTNTRSQDKFMLNEDFSLTVFADDESEDIIELMKANTEELDKIASVKAGLQAYESGKGEPKQTPDDVKNRPYDFNFKLDESTFPYLDGSNVNRYYNTWSGQWLQYGPQLAAPRTFDLFQSPKLIVREITGKYPHCMIATYSEETYLYNRSNIGIVPREGSQYSLKYLLAIINSSLFSYYFLKNTPKSVRQMFPKIILQDLKKFPIKEASTDEQQPLINLSDLMLLQANTLSKTLGSLQNFLKAKYEGLTITRKLAAWHTLTTNEFLKEIEKQKLSISFAEQANLIAYFEAEKAKAIEIDNDIVRIDQQINEVVFDLYKLSPQQKNSVKNGAI